jgi:predicted ATP-dependent protease
MRNAETPSKKFAAFVLSVIVFLPNAAIAQVVEAPVRLEAPAGPTALPALGAAPVAIDAPSALPEAATLDTLSSLPSLDGAPVAAQRGQRGLSRSLGVSRSESLSGLAGESVQGRQAAPRSIDSLRGLGAAAGKKDIESVFTSRYDGSAANSAAVPMEEGSGWFGSLISRLTGRSSKPAEPKLTILDDRHVAQYEVPARKLRRTFDPATLTGTKDAATPAELAGPVKIIGQDRAIEALVTSLRIEGRGTNVVVTGPKGSGRTTATLQIAEAIAQTKKGSPKDFVSAHNFDDPSSLRILQLEAGQGPAFQARMQQLVGQLQQAIPPLGELLQKVTNEQAEQIKAAADAKISLLGSELAQVELEGGLGMKLAHSKNGYGVALTHEGQVLKGGVEEAVEKNLLTPEQAEAVGAEVSAKSAPVFEKLGAIVDEANKDIAALAKEGRKQFEVAVGGLFDQITEDIPQTFKGPGVAAYMAGAKEFAAKHAGELGQTEDEQQQPRGNPMMMMLGGGGPRVPAAQAFEVEVLSSRKPGEGARVVHVKFPTYENMIGEIAEGPDGKPHMKLGALVTADQVIVDGEDLLAARGVLPIVLTALKNMEVEISEVRPDMVLMNKRGPVNREKVPISSKLVIIAEGGLGAALSAYYGDLFTMTAQFDRVMQQTPESIQDYVKVLARMVAEGGENFMHLAASGVAKVLEFSSYVADKQNKLTTEFGQLMEVVREATLVARDARAKEITGEHVMTALKMRERRSDLQERKQQEFILDEMMLIDTEGKKVGEINGVAVSGAGQKASESRDAVLRAALGVEPAAPAAPAQAAQDHAAAYGHPMKITATHGVGEGLVVVDEEVGQVGPITQEANGTIRGFLLGRYGRNRPLAARISLKFEQLYGGLEGDSASLASVLTMLSDLSGLPIRQDMIITGSMNQKGQAQVIGGENFKGPGWWKLVKKKGLTGTHGFVLPEGNLQGLHLPEEMVQDVVDGKFHVYGVRSIDEAIEIFFGVKAGSPDKNGNYPPDTVNGRVQKEFERLLKVAKQ